MIKVTRNDYTLTVEGHAGYAEVGKDIVCAAASMLFHTFLQEITRRDIAHTTGGTDGSCEFITVSPPREFTLDTEIVFDTICTGYKLLADAYPDHVSFTDES